MEYKIRVHGGFHRRQGTPVRLALPEDLAGKKVTLKDERTGLHVCSQILSQGDQQYLYWLLDDVLPGEVRTYALLTCEPGLCLPE